jgi:hypothetical protein
VRLQCSEHNVRRPREQLRDRGCDIGETLGVTTVGCGGQTMRTIAGMESGSTSSIFSWWWLIWLDARAVMDDGDTVPPGASRSRGALTTRTGTAYVWWCLPGGLSHGILHVCCTRYVRILRNYALTRSDSGAPGRIRTCAPASGEPTDDDLA